MSEKIEIPESRATRWLLFAICFGFVIVSLWIYSTTPDKLITGGAIVLFAIMSILLFRWAMSPGARVTLSDYGIEDRSNGVGLIEWQDIKLVSVGQVKSTVFLDLRLKNEAEYLDRLSSVRRSMAMLGTRMGFSPITIGTQGLKMDAQELVELIEQRRRSASSTRLKSF